MIPAWLHWLDNLPEFWGVVGGLAATRLKQQEAENRPAVTRPRTNDLKYQAQYFWNPLFGVLLTHLYVKSGSSLTALTAFITGGSAPIIVKQLLAALPQHLPGTKDIVKVRGRAGKAE